jgi:hypothetical protein
MEYLKSKDRIVAERLGSVNEAARKHGDTWKVSINIPRSLINAFVSKAKKDYNIDPREQWSDMDLAEFIASYVESTFINIDSLPVQKILGDLEKTPGEVKTMVQPTEMPPVQPDAQPITPQAEPQPVAQPMAQPVQGPTGEIQNESKNRRRNSKNS